MKNWSHSLRRSFVKDYSLPISVVQSPYFEHQIDFLDRQYQTYDKVQLLCEALHRFGSEDKLFVYMKETREKIIDAVKSHPKYSEFGENTPEIFAQLDGDRPKVPDKCVYKQENVGLRMVSVDLVSANFQTFKLSCPELVQYCGTYDEFVSLYTDLPYFKQSKKIRQIIFGNLNPKKQQVITKKMMWSIWHHLQRTNTNLDLSMMSSDELILREKPQFVQKTLEELETILLSHACQTRVQNFWIEPVKMKTSSAFVKRFPDNSFDLKCCPGPYTIEVLRHIYGEEVHPYDRVFFADGRLCEYKDSLFD